ncbi:hypothetical protein HY624_01385 [Candidatus Uhrbacteria bacterium]|nr:hypothetical protein [Candidatus Uhrbacteria bacterium]
MSFRRFQFVIRIILIIIPVILFFWLLAKDFVVTGRLVVEYDFSNDSPFIRHLRSPDNVGRIQLNKVNRDSTQSMKRDPVTFDVQLPRRFVRTIVELRYTKNPEQEFRLGLQRRKGTVSPELHDLALVGTDGPWTIGTATFDHLERFDFSKDRYQFFLSAPGLTRSKDPILLTSIRIIFEREPWTMNNFFPRVWNFFKRK